jgi:hypothetical protein
MRVQPGLSRPHPTLPPPRGPRFLANDAGTWFEAPCGFGSVRVCAGPGGESACHAAEAALVLGCIEPLLAALDGWIGAELDWRWVEAPPRGAGAARASARWRASAEAPACLVSWPWALLRTLSAPPPALAAQLEWPMNAAVLVLARLQLGPDELGLLEPGGAVLLPPSMRPPWQGVLRAADEPPEPSAGVAVDLSVPGRPRLAVRSAVEPAGAPLPDPSCVACELRLELPLGVDGQRLAGWCRDGDAGEIVQLAESAMRVSLWRCATAGRAEQGLADGRLMPWGDGWAFALESIDSSLQAGAAQKV